MAVGVAGPQLWHGSVGSALMAMTPCPPFQNPSPSPGPNGPAPTPPWGGGWNPWGVLVAGVMIQVLLPGPCLRGTVRHGLRLGLVVAVVLQVTPFAAGSLRPLFPADGRLLPTTATDGSGPTGLCV
jgi:hypothetical protein